MTDGLAPFSRNLKGRAGDAVRGGWKAALFLAVCWFAGSLAQSLLWRFRLQIPLVLWVWVSALLILGISWVFLALEGRSVVSLGLELGRAWTKDFLAGALGGIVLLVLIALTAWGFGGFHWEWSGGAGVLGSGAWLFLAVAVREELVFRGYPFQRLVEGTGDWFALGLSGAYFALAHGSNPGMTGSTELWATLNIGLAGILMGLCYLKTRSLGLPMGLHLGWNWAQGSLMGFGVSGIHMGSWLRPVFHDRPLWLTGGSFGLEASLPCAVLTGAAIFLLARCKARPWRKATA